MQLQLVEVIAHREFQQPICTTFAFATVCKAHLCWSDCRASTGEQPPAAKLVVQRQSNLAAGQSGQGPSSLAPVSMTAAASLAESPLQPVQASAAAQHSLAGTPAAAVIAEAAAVLPDTGPVLAASTVNSSLPLVAAAPVAATLRKALKLAPPISPQQAMRQRLQQARSGAESSLRGQVQPGELPVTYAVSTLTQPGPLFIRSFPKTSLDSSTTLPQANSVHRHSQAYTAGQCAHAACRISLHCT